MGSNTGWPAILSAPLTDSESAPLVVLRPLSRRDDAAWARLRSTNREWLSPWEATAPVSSKPPMDFAAWVKSMRKQAKAGTTLPFVVELDGQVVGQVTVASIALGSIRSAVLGYWISKHVAGRGVIPLAVALAADHCYFTLGLHRIEVNVMPHNERSLRVVEKLGFRDEGVRERFMHIQGQWRDHRTFALTVEEIGEGLVARLAR